METRVFEPKLGTQNGNTEESELVQGATPLKATLKHALTHLRNAISFYLQVVVANNGPCYGEVGNGERFRTQGIPKKMKELEFAHVMMVGTAANMAIYVLRDTEEEDQEEMEEFETLDQADMEYTA